MLCFSFFDARKPLPTSSHRLRPYARGGALHADEAPWGLRGYPMRKAIATEPMGIAKRFIAFVGGVVDVDRPCAIHLLSRPFQR